LTQEFETGTKLSLAGEQFFRGAIYGIQSMAPNAFSYQLQAVTTDTRTWSLLYATSLESQWAGTWVQDAKDAGTALLGTGYDLLSIILVLGMCAGLVVGNLLLTGDHWNGLIDAGVVLILTARLGMYPLVFFGLLLALCMIYISATIWGLFTT